jgi:molybdate transport system ATP-binding protein
VALARILLSNPEILMLDEPFSALDGYLRWNLELELSEILEEFSGPILFVSHSRDEVYRICDRVCVMDRGQSSPVIPVRQLFEYPETKAAALLSGCKNYSRAEPTADGKIFAKDWGITFESEGAVLPDLAWLGVRSHYVRLVPGEQAAQMPDAIHCRIIKVVDDVFSTVILVQPVTAVRDESLAGAHYERIRVELPKDAWENFRSQEKDSGELWIRIAPGDLMQLK